MDKIVTPLPVLLLKLVSEWDLAPTSRPCDRWGPILHRAKDPGSGWWLRGPGCPMLLLFVDPFMPLVTKSSQTETSQYLVTNFCLFLFFWCLPVESCSLVDSGVVHYGTPEGSKNLFTLGFYILVVTLQRSRNCVVFSRSAPPTSPAHKRTQNQLKKLLIESRDTELPEN